ncbi:MAG: hypothetical protein ACRD2B_08060 [Terriglobia bacterium]
MEGRRVVLLLCAIAAIGVSTLASGQLRAAPALGTIANSPARTASVNKAAYDARMLALANVPPRASCVAPEALASEPSGPAQEPRDAAYHAVTFITKAAGARPCPAALWPVRGVYPDAGALLPFRRIVAYYGNFYSPRMGVLGEYPPGKVLEMLKSAAAAWAKADPSTPVVPALDYIAVSAQGVPGRDGMYRMRMPPSQIEKAISMADQIHGLLFLDVQPGWSTVRIEVPRLAPYLKLPNLELALDPEFALTRGKRPGAWIGTMSAAEIDFAAQFLAKIVEQNHLPPKILVVHRFTQDMVTDFRAIEPLPQVEIVMDMDGFGSRPLKVSTYKDFISSQPVQFTGFKLFYINDVKSGGHLMAPARVLALSPRPIYIVYQ